MKYWYFFFEGRFRQDEPQFAGKGVFSTCLVPWADYVQAESLMKEGLDYHGIDLIQIKESFEVDPEELDANDPDNHKWLDWCKEARKEETVLFDPWQLFDLEDSDSA